MDACAEIQRLIQDEFIEATLEFADGEYAEPTGVRFIWWIDGQREDVTETVRERYSCVELAAMRYWLMQMRETLKAENCAEVVWAPI
jgi:hypothetical protein